MSPGGEVLQPGLHLRRGSPVQKLQQAAQLFADRVTLLASEDNATMRMSVGDPFLMERTEIADIEAVQHTPVGIGIAQMFFVASVDHFAVGSGDDINMPCAQGDDER